MINQGLENSSCHVQVDSWLVRQISQWEYGLYLWIRICILKALAEGIDLYVLKMIRLIPDFLELHSLKVIPASVALDNMAENG